MSIGQMQFGFMPEKGAKDVIMILRQIQEMCLGEIETLFYSFVDLENRVPREVVCWTLRKPHVDE